MRGRETDRDRHVDRQTHRQADKRTDRHTLIEEFSINQMKTYTNKTSQLKNKDACTYVHAYTHSAPYAPEIQRIHFGFHS